MRRNSSERSRPEFRRSDRGRVDYEFVAGFVKSCCGLNAGHIAAMTKLSLSVATQKLKIINQGHPSGSLLIRSQKVNRFSEHALVQVDD